MKTCKVAYHKDTFVSLLDNPVLEIISDIFLLYNAVLYGETSGIYVTLEQGRGFLEVTHVQHGNERR